MIASSFYYPFVFSFTGGNKHERILRKYTHKYVPPVNILYIHKCAKLTVPFWIRETLNPYQKNKFARLGRAIEKLRD
jgi:hypothetical protein